MHFPRAKNAPFVFTAKEVKSHAHTAVSALSNRTLNRMRPRCSLYIFIIQFPHSEVRVSICTSRGQCVCCELQRRRLHVRIKSTFNTQ